MDNLIKAKNILKKNNYTFVLLANGKTVKVSHKRGIMAFMEIIRDNKKIIEDSIIADKVIGKAAAMLAAQNKVKAIYAEILSRKAKEVLDDYSIFCQYEHIVDFIQNRTKDDKCPMEKLTEHIIDPEIAYMQILQFYLKVLKIDLS
ncbi:MAG: DUF1893 domain-containing protein [Atribacterota bacterium]|jgi:iron complex outermembrane receptor protein|nr:DUF1893 domain-containing protein [Atribacterota bacterium]MDD3641088.1 DUF1893 domain-containing protein [Atribacterota bacterium]MDD4764763.1 DUF1893 domain-containing protein [Atribacterota bacterium]